MRIIISGCTVALGYCMSSGGGREERDLLGTIWEWIKWNMFGIDKRK